MALKVPLVSEIYLLNYILTAASLRMKLYSNNYTPVQGSVIASFTEANFSGYAAYVVAAGNWTTPVNDGAGRAISFNLANTWANSTGAVGNSIYGYFVTDAGGTNLCWAERLAAAPVDMTTAGKTMSIQPVLTFLTEF